MCRLTDGPFVHIGGDEAVGATEDSFVRSIRELLSLVKGFGERPVGRQESSRAGNGLGGIAQFWFDVPTMDLPARPPPGPAGPRLG
ncbi:hypothetical protein ACWDBC_34865 [Streptomyces parvus]|uniref:hypothetical protein n=1 Tax=Streptomyces parvus TaxID=66428 RepID=UPI00331FF1CB